MLCSSHLLEMRQMGALHRETLTDDEMKRVITGTYPSIMSRFIRAGVGVG